MRRLTAVRQWSGSYLIYDGPQLLYKLGYTGVYYRWVSDSQKRITHWLRLGHNHCQVRWEIDSAVSRQKDIEARRREEDEKTLTDYLRM